MNKSHISTISLYIILIRASYNNISLSQNLIIPLHNYRQDTCILLQNTQIIWHFILATYSLSWNSWTIYVTLGTYSNQSALHIFLDMQHLLCTQHFSSFPSSTIIPHLLSCWFLQSPHSYLKRVRKGQSNHKSVRRGQCSSSLLNI